MRIIYIQYKADISRACRSQTQDVQALSVCSSDVLWRSNISNMDNLGKDKWYQVFVNLNTNPKTTTATTPDQGMPINLADFKVSYSCVSVERGLADNFVVACSCRSDLDPKTGLPSVICANEQLWSTTRDSVIVAVGQWENVKLDLTQSNHPTDYKKNVDYKDTDTYQDKRYDLILEFSVRCCTTRLTHISCVAVQRGVDDNFAVTCENKRLWKSEYANDNNKFSNIWHNAFVELSSSINSDYKV
ncbi:unnamed protein product [Trichobilharzia szidati]|nr:unnamed protein product [Trichobilharzia szidati]